MQTSLFELPVTEQLGSSVSLRQKEELSLIVVHHPLFKAALSLQGAQLLAWQPNNHAPVIWLSEKTEFTLGKAIRGGVPICWPWFGPAGKPAHGFARTAQWQLKHQQENSDGVEIVLNLTQSEQTLRLWPHNFELTLTASLSAEKCHLELQISGNFTSTAALHSYFQVGDIDEVVVKGLGETFIDKVANGLIGHQAEAQRYQQEVDRIFTAPLAVSQIEDRSSLRTINVEHHGNSDVVTWNPWLALSTSMADMADEGYKTMVCVETARINQPIASSSQTPAGLGVTITPHRLD